MMVFGDVVRQKVLSLVFLHIGLLDKSCRGKASFFLKIHNNDEN